MSRSRRSLAGTVLSLVALSAAAAGCGLTGEPEMKTLTADFDRTVGVYEQSDVRILGVKVGQVTDITPLGDKVRVTMQYEAKYKVPADASAVLVAPSIVSDRYVQLTPVYRGGAEIADGVRLTPDRTAVPVELDEIYDALNELNVSLGPQGANKDGALSDLLSVGARNLEGNGDKLGSTLEDFSVAVKTLSDSRNDLFGTIANLQDFTTTIANSDDTVRRFNADLALVADQLAAERGDLARATAELSTALGEVATFVRDNREVLTANVTDLAQVTSVLVKQKTALEEFLDVAPTALTNLQLAYNPQTGTLDTRDNGMAQREAAAEEDPLGFLCSILQTGDPEGGARACEQIRGALAALPGGGLPSPPSGPAAAPASVPAAPVAPAAPARDMTLGGILDGGR